MLVTSILGSPRKKGNTNRVLGWVEEALQSEGHRAERINTVDHKINGCKGCFTCKRFTEKPGCAQEDDALRIMDRLIASDAIIYGSPIYFWGPTAQMKTLMDRHCSLVTGFGKPSWQSLLEGRRTGFVVTCEDAVENNAELIIETFERFADYLKCHNAGVLVIPHTSKPDALGDEVKERATALARKVVGKT